MAIEKDRALRGLMDLVLLPNSTLQGIHIKKGLQPRPLRLLSQNKPGTPY